MYPIERVWHVRSFAQPHLVIETFRNWLRCGIASRRVARESDLYSLQIADAPVTYQLGRIAKLDCRTLLTADLHDAPGRLDSTRERATLGDGQRCGLLQIDVLPRLD